MPVLSLFSRARLFAVVLSVSPIASFAQSGSLPVLPEDVFPDLKGILAEAVQQSPRMLALSLGQEIAAADLVQARSGLFPSAGGFLQASVTRDKREGISDTLSTDKLYYNFSITQPVYHWGERRNNARIGEINKRIADRNYGDAYRLLVQEIRTAYLQMIILKGRVAEARFNLEQAQETLRVTEERLARGVISESEAFQPRIGADQAALNTDRTADAFAEAKRRFSVLTGRPAPEDGAIPDEIPPVVTADRQIDSLLAGFL
jgi:outer membrane protein TolC